MKLAVAPGVRVSEKTLTTADLESADEVFISSTTRDLLPVSMWPAEGCLACLVFAALTLAEIPLAYLARRVLLLDEGPGVSEGHLGEKITVINANNESVTIYVDPTTHLPLEKHFSSRDPRYRERDEEVTIYGDWKAIQGINTPRITMTKRNGEILSQQITFNVTYNMHPADSLFDPAVAKINPVKTK